MTLSSVYGWCLLDLFEGDLGISKNNGTPMYPQIIHFNRVFYYKPSILGYPYFWKHPFVGNVVEKHYNLTIFFAWFEFLKVYTSHLLPYKKIDNTVVFRFMTES